MTASDAGETSRREIKSYRKSRRKKSRRRLQDPRSGALIASIMAILTCAYLAAMGVFWYISTSGYAGAGIRSNPSEVLYSLGSPDLVRSGPNQPWMQASDPRRYSYWRYRTPLLEVRFDDGTGRVRTISCDFDEAISRMPCPPALGVGIGTHETEVIEKLGWPSSQYLSNGRKVMRYDETGHEFVLERVRVRSIRLSEADGGFLAGLKRFLIWIIP